MNAILSRGFFYDRFVSNSPLDYYVSFIKYYNIYQNVISVSYLNGPRTVTPNKLVFYGDKSKIGKYLKSLEKYDEYTELRFAMRSIAFYKCAYDYSPTDTNKDARNNIFHFDILQHKNIDSLYDFIIEEINYIMNNNPDPISYMNSYCSLQNTKYNSLTINGVFTNKYYYQFRKISIKNIHSFKIITNPSTNKKELSININVYEIFKKIKSVLFEDLRERKIYDFFFDIYDKNKEKTLTNIEVIIRNQNADIKFKAQQYCQCMLIFNTTGYLYRPDESMIGIGVNCTLNVGTSNQYHDIQVDANYILLSKDENAKLISSIRAYGNTSASSFVYRTGGVDQIEHKSDFKIVNIALEKDTGILGILIKNYKYGFEYKLDLQDILTK
ncbi:MAG: hypothetical protein QXF12_02500 [Candidatus Aenigmatarchaeota archaeon]